MDIWNQIVGAFLGLIIGTLLGNELSRFLYRPKVIIRFKEISPLNTENGFFWSIMVINIGRTVATNCIGTISIDDLEYTDVLEPHEAMSDESLPEYKDENIDLEFPRSQLVTLRSFRSLKNNTLCWSQLGNPFQIDINPGMVQSLDICKNQYNVEKNYWYCIIPSEKGWRKVRLRVKIKELTGQILICPSNEFPTRIEFLIKISPENLPVFSIKKSPLRKKIRDLFLRPKNY